MAANILDNKEVRKVIFASSLGTVFEWYDFYLYAVLAPFFAAVFFPPGNATAALLSAFATYAAGFLVRPFGALVFGRVGDLVGRKYTFLVTIVVMGFSTFAVGLLPTFQTIGWAAPVLLVSLRLLQGLALGGEYGGAATYVAEHAAEGKRGYDTAWIQTTATLGLFLALIIIALCRFTGWIEAKDFTAWGWRIPFLVSLILLVFSIYIRLKLNESPVFQRMKAEGKGSKAPLSDSFLKYPNNKYVLLALLGATAGQGVVWYTGQFYALFFLLITLKVDGLTAYTLIAVSLVLGTPFFIVFGWLSDKIGRLKIILTGCLIAAVTYFPLFQGLTHYVNPALEEYSAKTPITVAATECQFHIFVGPWSTFTDCDRTKDFLTKQGLSFKSVPAEPGKPVVTTIGTTRIEGWDQKKTEETLKAAGYKSGADKAQVNWFMTELILVIMVIYVTMVYGPIAAFLVELFPTQIRYTSMSLPYHIGNGVFGGLVPFIGTLIYEYSKTKENPAGNVLAGLSYPMAIAAICFIIGALY